MPIYAYRCSACGHQQDVLQKMSDAPLTDCPACGQSSYAKQVTAAGFQLKGSGWYVTDFRNNATKPASQAGNASSGKDSAQAAKPAAAGSTESAAATPASTEPAASSSAAAAST